MLLCHNEYKILIDNILSKILFIVSQIVNERYYTNNENTSIEYFIKNKNQSTINLTYYNNLFYFPNFAEFNSNLETLRKYIFTLFVLVQSIPVTSIFINTFLNKLIVYKEYEDLHNRITNARFAYLNDKANEKASTFLPTSWWESFTNRFISKKIDGTYIVKIPFKDYCKKVHFMYETCKIENELKSYTFNNSKWNDYSTSIFTPTKVDHV